jgi:hypothetical protein
VLAEHNYLMGKQVVQVEVVLGQTVLSQLAEFLWDKVLQEEERLLSVTSAAAEAVQVLLVEMLLPSLSLEMVVQEHQILLPELRLLMLVVVAAAGVMLVEQVARVVPAAVVLVELMEAMVLQELLTQAAVVEEEDIQVVLEEQVGQE